MIPPEVMTAWLHDAEPTAVAERQARDHISHEHNQPIETCWYCGRSMAVCHSKRRYADLTAAYEACDALNHPESDRLVLPYRCYWSPGLHWHVTTAKTTARRRKARKRMAQIARGRWI